MRILSNLRRHRVSRVNRYDFPSGGSICPGPKCPNLGNLFYGRVQSSLARGGVARPPVGLEVVLCK